jgi:hypothetical protein
MFKDVGAGVWKDCPWASYGQIPRTRNCPFLGRAAIWNVNAANSFK